VNTDRGEEATSPENEETPDASGKTSSEEAIRAERAAISRHREHLCKLQCREITDEEATADWLAHHALEWRQKRMERMMAMQRDEILRHKWLESEKHKCDMGTEAIFDWIHKYAAAWRKWFDDHFD